MSCASFVSQSFAVRTAAHLLHLTSKSYSQHMALGDFYAELTDLTDKYAEVYMGQEGVPSFPSAVPPRGTPVGVLSDYLDLVRDEQKEPQEGQALMNILAEIEELTLRTLYKLKNLA